jgi:hypothetical protein
MVIVGFADMMDGYGLRLRRKLRDVLMDDFGVSVDGECGVLLRVAENWDRLMWGRDVAVMW